VTRLAVALATFLLLALSAFSPAHAQTEDPIEEQVESEQLDYFVDESTLPFDALPGFENTERHWGVHQGAGYRYEVPAEWNGDLVLWAHGFRGNGLRLFFEEREVPTREWLLENGYAWAASTFSRNSYSTGTAVTDMRRLGTLFRQQVDRPGRVYISGASMGGHISAASLERHPDYYDGALTLCGALGDTGLFDYYLDISVASQQLGLGQSAFPVGLEFLALAQQIKAELEAVPGGWPFLLNERGQAYKQLVENRSGGDRPDFEQAWVFWNTNDFLFSLGTGDGTFTGSNKVAVTNRDVYYETDLVPGPSNPIEEALNAEVVRVNFDRFARRRSPNAPSVPLRGTISAPMLSLHNLGDLFVPFSGQIQYQEKVASKGRSDLLVQRAIRGTGHCEFSPLEYDQAMSDLVDWVETGVKPEGDVVDDPAVVAGADYGCRFTDPDPQEHPFATPC
jgi:pimeloyl-ACP methyl ester carboxylesterase